MFNLKIITAANDNYILTLLDFIHSFFRLSLNLTTLIVYDLGLNNTNKDLVLELQKLYSFELKTFDYDIYPEHVNLNLYNGLYCSYAFKPIIIYNEANNKSNKGSILIWMDSANRFDIQNISSIYNLLNNKGFYSPYSNQANTIESIELNHPSCVSYFGLTKEEHHTKLFSISANLIGINYETTEGKDILDTWYNSSLLKDVIMPHGSSRNNHRQDQTILSIIVYLYQIKNNINFTYDNFGVKFWNKLDKPTTQIGYYPFGLFKKNYNHCIAIIFCKDLDEARNVYISRKGINTNDFDRLFYVSLQN
uniref:Uncharacterized protein n=1 Tax=viral metagenome TaxID=1070528 RepID=A0A6C0E8K6_9ZZZZ